MRKLLLSLGAGVASVTLLAGCSSLYLEKESIESEISQQIEEQFGVTPEVSCPDDLPGEVDAQIECDLTLPEDDELHKIQVTAKSVNEDTKEVGYEFEVLD